jgi:hypothetical protein
VARAVSLEEHGGFAAVPWSTAKYLQSGVSHGLRYRWFGRFE